VRGAGGYQMFGVTPMPIFDPQQRIKYLQDFMIFFKPGDLVKFSPIDRDTYDAAVEAVEANEFEPKIRDVRFSLDEFNADINACNAKLEGALK
jgi:urea carboxylase